MVFSKKPLHFIIATLFACLPLVSFANPTTDSVKVSTENHATTESHEEKASEKGLTQDEKK